MVTTNTLTKTIQYALSNETKRHSISRQLGLIAWLNEIQKTGLSIAQSIFYNIEELSHDNYLIIDSSSWASKPAPIYQIAIMNSNYLAQRWPFARKFRPNKEAPNLYISRISGTNHHIAIELNPDESSITQALMQQPRGLVSSPSILTNDPTLQKQVEIIWDRLQKRLKKLNMPILSRDGLALPLPNRETENYQNQLEYALSQDPELLGQTWMPVKEDTSPLPIKTITSLSNPTDYTIYNKPTRRKKANPRWQKLNAIEIAIQEDRLITNTLLIPPGQNRYRIFGMNPSKQNEKDRLHTVVINERSKDAELIIIGKNGNISRQEWKDSFPDCEAKSYTELDIEASLNHYKNSKAIDTWIRIIFETINQREGDVTLNHFFNLIACI